LSRGAILVVDDDALFRAALRRSLEGKGYEVSAVGGASDALEALEQRAFDVLLTDLRMPGRSGIELIRQVRQAFPDVVCLLITGFGSAEASTATREAGGFWYVPKNYDQVDSMEPLIQSAIEHGRLQRTNRRLQRQLENRYGLQQIIGQSEALRATLDVVQRVADTDATVLILGESGVGKDLIARALHYNSSRAEQPFVAVNCGAIPEQLLESELFGHVRGAFTGALKDRVGRFAAADGGTLFLDEIADMSSNLQTKLLRVLQERSFEPVGSNKTEHVDVRIIAATNQDLCSRIQAGSFREDLYFRLAVIPIEVPPLRERRDDIPLLVEHFLQQLRAEYPEVKGMTETALKRLVYCDWPGNIRQLQAMIQRLVILKRSGWIDESDLPAELLGGIAEAPAVSLPPEGVDFQALVSSFESDLITQALEATGWNKNQAAALLNLKRTTLVEKIRSKGLKPTPRA
jgi:DNA-binding NtrC family response regulator